MESMARKPLSPAGGLGVGYGPLGHRVLRTGVSFLSVKV